LVFDGTCGREKKGSFFSHPTPKRKKSPESPPVLFFSFLKSVGGGKGKKKNRSNFQLLPLGIPTFWGGRPLRGREGKTGSACACPGDPKKTEGGGKKRGRKKPAIVKVLQYWGGQGREKKKEENTFLFFRKGKKGKERRPLSSSIIVDHQKTGTKRKEGGRKRPRSISCKSAAEKKGWGGGRERFPE